MTESKLALKTELPARIEYSDVLELAYVTELGQIRYCHVGQFLQPPGRIVPVWQGRDQDGRQVELVCQPDGWHIFWRDPPPSRHQVRDKTPGRMAVAAGCVIAAAVLYILGVNVSPRLPVTMVGIIMVFWMLAVLMPLTQVRSPRRRRLAASIVGALGLSLMAAAFFS